MSQVSAQPPVLMSQHLGRLVSSLRRCPSAPWGWRSSLPPIPSSQLFLGTASKSPPALTSATSCAYYRATHLLLDSERRIIGALVSQLQDEGWKAACSQAFDLLHRAAQRLKQEKTGLEAYGRRGVAASITHGLSLGPGLSVHCFFPKAPPPPYPSVCQRCS